MVNTVSNNFKYRKNQRWCLHKLEMYMVVHIKCPFFSHSQWFNHSHEFHLTCWWYIIIFQAFGSFLYFNLLFLLSLSFSLSQVFSFSLVFFCFFFLSILLFVSIYSPSILLMPPNLFVLPTFNIPSNSFPSESIVFSTHQTFSFFPSQICPLLLFFLFLHCQSVSHLFCAPSYRPFLSCWLINVFQLQFLF